MKLHCGALGNTFGAGSGGCLVVCRGAMVSMRSTDLAKALTYTVAHQKH